MPSSPTTTPERPPSSSDAEWQLLARSSPAGLALATDRRHQLPAHIDLLDQRLVDVAAGDLGFVALGRRSARPAVWHSVDGRAWTAVGGTEFEGVQALKSSVAVGRNGAVVVATLGAGYGTRVAAWFSADGLTWARLREGSFGVGQTVSDVTAFGSGFVAVGSERRPDGSSVPAAWTARDGADWVRVAHQEAFDYTGAVDTSGGTSIASVAAAPGRLFAVGSDGVWAKAWTSSDGLAWHRADLPPQLVHAALFHSVDGVAISGGETLVAASVGSGPALWHLGRDGWADGAAGGAFASRGPSISVRGVTPWGTGYLAVGSMLVEHVDRAARRGAVWLSSNGFTWEQVPDPDAVWRDAAVNAVAPFEGGFVAVGQVTTDSTGKPAVAAVWTSTDGRRWQRVRHDVALFGNDGYHSLTRVTAGPRGLVAVGLEYRTDGLDALVLFSRDGRSWHRGGDPALFRGDAHRVAYGVCAGPFGYVAVGYEEASSGADAVAWHSADGLSWRRAEGHALGGPRDQVMTSCAAGDHGVLAGGSDDAGGDADGALWRSLDGVRWDRVPVEPSVLGGAGSQSVWALGHAEGSVVAAVADYSGGDGDLAVWTSDVPTEWRRAPAIEAVFGGPGYQGPRDIAAVNGTVVVVGDAGPAGGVWVRPARRDAAPLSPEPRPTGEVLA